MWRFSEMTVRSSSVEDEPELVVRTPHKEYTRSLLNVCRSFNDAGLHQLIEEKTLVGPPLVEHGIHGARVPYAVKSCGRLVCGQQKATILYQRGLQVRGEQGDEIDLAPGSLPEYCGEGD